MANVENNTDTCYVNISDSNPYLLEIYIPLSISDTSLFEDMLTYVLPAGMSYRIIRQLTINVPEAEEELWFNLSDLQGESTSPNIIIKRNNQTIASQVLQARNSGEMEQSSQLSAGRIEDMSIVKYQGDTIIDEYVKDDKVQTQEETFTESIEQVYPADNNTNNGE